ncbi:hypothetical protein TNIN_232001 [Trichonephila inaurata madagascariensis]|uniref:Uncharacterized protein n=1 Tax=Trichonephila inaurata madagascariensis TaxID=2747483 RepID=A0A8X6XRX9_9ARAC|nr:hypothetical protein TNIN_232001 [Trichonephila inaurata madagascariensis]
MSSAIPDELGLLLSTIKNFLYPSINMFCLSSLVIEILRLSQSEMGCVAGIGIPVPVGVEDLLEDKSVIFRVAEESLNITLTMSLAFDTRSP